jgi:hypothetical protein
MRFRKLSVPLDGSLNETDAGSLENVNSETGQLLGKFQTRCKHINLDPMALNVDLQRKKRGLAKFRLMVIRITLNPYLNQDNIIKIRFCFTSFVGLCSSSLDGMSHKIMCHNF